MEYAEKRFCNAVQENWKLKGRILSKKKNLSEPVHEYTVAMAISIYF